MALRPFGVRPERDPYTRAPLPSVSVALIGDAGAGKTTLLSALTLALANRGWGVLVEFYALDCAAIERQNGESSSLSHVTGRTSRRRHLWIDCPGRVRYTRNAYNGIAQADIGVLVVAADQGLTPHARELVRIAAHVGVRDWVVFLSKIDAPDVGAELLELSELEVREFMNSLELAGDDVVVLRGAPQRVLELAGVRRVIPLDRPNEAAPLWALLDVIDAFALPRRDDRGAFWMPIDDVFARYGPRSVIVTGKVARGSLALGDEFDLLGFDQSARGVVRSLHQARAPVERVSAGDHAGVWIEGRTRWNTRRGQVLCAPGRGDMRQTLRVRLRALTSEEGGRSTPYYIGYRPQLHVHTADVTATVVESSRVDTPPGASRQHRLTLHAPIFALPGQRIVLRASDQTVALGEIID
ncbi:MAG: 50S ribosome-binding GTPase [Myxococcales bacterium]|nr:50S ribosome-binding GTPase [Myxococcales bacterium]